MTCACILFFILSIVYTNGQIDRKSSLTFVIDVTRSMETVRRQVEQHANAIFDAVVESNASYIENFVLVTFADPDKYRSSVNNVTDTKDRDEFKNSLKLKLISGGDCPEYSMSGILTGIENSAPGSTIYVFTDASAKDYNTYDHVKDKAQKKEIQVMFILTGKCDLLKYGTKGYSVYEELARDTSGNVFNLHKTNIVDIIKYIKDAIIARRINLAVKSFPPGIGFKFNYTIDHATKDTTVAISCFNVSFNITGPDNETLEATKLVKLQNITVLKVNETKLGVHTITIDCKSDSRILVTAKSDIQFLHGFSAFVPTSLNDTTVKPSPDGKSYLLIKVVGQFLPQTVQLLDVFDKLIHGYTITLKALDETQKLFLTEPFETPFIMFRILITGENIVYNETITRIGTILVEPQTPGTGDTKQRTPTITIEGGPKITVEVDTPLQLKCSVSAYPRPNITWEKNGKVLETDVYDYDLPYLYVSVHKIEKVNKNETYECKAKNIRGDDSQSVIIETKHKAVGKLAVSPSVFIKESDPIDAEYDEPLNITCQVLGYPKPDIVWINTSNNTELEADVEEISSYQFTSSLSIDKITANATYQCKANNTLGDDAKKVAVKTVRKPFFEVLISPKDQTYNIQYNTTQTFSCKVDAFPPAEVNWYKNGDILSKDDISVSSDGYVLTIKHMQPIDAGKFMCEVKNVYHNNKYPFQIQITGVAEPKIDPFLKTVHAVENSDKNITCRIAKGTPKPTIQWFYNDTVSNLFMEIKDAENHEVLSLTNIKKEEKGLYKCLTTNVLGSDTMESTLVVEYAPAVDDDSEPVTVKAGQEVTLTCSAEGVPEPVVVWLKDGKPLVGSNSKFVSSSDHRLIFNSDLDDSGAYKCNASNKLGSDSKIIIVQVVKSPTVLFKESDPIDAEYDEPLNITCQVLGYPKPHIVWTNTSNNTELEADVEEDSPYQLTSYLTIGKVTANATYQCKANNKLGDDEKKVEVKTVRKPFFEVLISPKDQTYDIQYNTTQTFSCKADAFPPAEVNWYKNGNILSKDDISVSSDGYVLTIKHMQPIDAGKFICEVKNAYHNNKYPFQIQITGVAKPKIDPYIKKVYTTENSNKNITCRISKGTPKPTIQWFYNDTVSNLFMEIKDAENHEVLSLTNIKKEEKGLYKCLATNVLGSDTMESTLVVEYAPIVDNDSEPVTVKDGQEVTLTCSAEGVPGPVVAWLKDGKPLVDSKFVSSSDHRLIFNSDLDDSGAYKCNASNKLGSDSKIIIVQVVKSPTVLFKESDPIDAEYDEPLNITCQVLGYPKPHIVWTNTSNNTELEADVEEDSPYQLTSYLTIGKVTANATYQCKANNKLGDDEKKVEVKTVRKPFFEVLISPKDQTYDIQYNTTQTFSCKADAFPPAEVNWYKNGNILSKDDISVSSDGYVLTIKHMQPIDAGKFICEVKNAYHNNKYPFQIQITGVAKPKIDPYIKKVYTAENSNKNITCRISKGTPKPTIQWFYNDTVSNLFMEIKDAENHEVLSLTNIKKEEKGLYKCLATNVLGSDTMESTLVVEYAPIVDNDSEPVTVKDGQEVTLTCSAEGFPEPVVAWLKDGKPLVDSKFVSSSDHRLIFNSDLDDSGAYKCNASNKLGSDSKIIIVQVVKSPTVSFKESDPIDAEYDEPLNITCQVLGYPKPHIVWTNTSNNTELEADVEEDSPYQFTSFLSIGKVTANATYQCKANNTHGDDEKKVEVKTVRKPFFEVLISPKDQTYDIQYNTTQTFSCKADAFPPAEVNWYKNGNILSRDDISVSSDGYVLTIKHMQPIDAGKFICEVKNAYHNNKYPFQIQITGVAEPKIDPYLKTVYTAENSDKNITCRIAKGTPKPTIQWFYNDTVSYLFMEIKDAENHEVLSLTNIKKEEKGLYKCLATNVLGSDTMESTLVVEYKPAVFNDSEPITVKAGEEVMLSCLADGFPEPVIVWHKDGKPLVGSKFVSSSDHRLIFNSNLDDSGQYKCYASNKLGSDSKLILVQVQKLPAVTIEGHLKRKVDFGEELYLKCNVVGNPAPDIRWIDITNRIVLSGSTSSVKFPYEYLNVLSIDNVNQNATYQCEANNTLGEDRASVVVEAVMKNHFYLTEEPKDIAIAYGTDGKLYCIVDAYPPAKITWLKQNHFVLSRLTNKDDLEISDDGTTLTLKNMQPNQQGIYFCKASNTENEKTSMAKVTISGVEMPKIFKTSTEKYIRDYPVKEGDNVLLTCKIVGGKPKPIIKWHYKNKHLKKFIEIKMAENQETFLVSNVRRDDNAMYACEAVNIMGSDSLKMDLLVEYPPTIKNDTNKYSIEAGGEVNIPCLVDGKPEPSVKWTKDPGALKFAPTPDHSFRLITNLGDSGTYTCTATNKHGTARRTVSIDVYTIGIQHRGKKMQAVDEYETLELECKGRGRPKPAIKWLFEGTSKESKNLPEELLDDSEELEIDEIRNDQRGRYTCVAYNDVGGNATFTYEVDVYTAVKIHNRERLLRAVDGDKALPIHCNATGNPKPYYKWVINGAAKSAGDTNDTIFLHDVNIKYNSSEVHCEAINKLDSRDSMSFNVIVDDYPSLNNPNYTLKRESGTEFEVACPVPQKTGDYLRWYKDKKKIHEGELYIKNAQTSDAGLYTCRVSDFDKAESANIILKVGSKLRFMNTDVNTTFSLGFGELVNFDCEAVGDPIPKVSWSFSGKTISTADSYPLKMDQAKVGKYKCEASNDVDSISRTFDVTLNECLLKIDSNSKKQPLIITQHFSWPSYKYDSGYLYMPRYQTVLFVCQNTGKLNLFDYNFVYAYCNKTGETAQLLIDERPYDYSDLQCTQEVKPHVKWTGKPCLGGDSEKVKIVYEVLHKAIDVYEVCMDLSNDIPFYTKQDLRLPLADSAPKPVTWFNDRLSKYDFDKLYDVNEQLMGIGSMMRRQWHRYDHCAFSKRHLVNPLDVFPGLPPRATFTHLNVVPHWSTCSSENWDDVELRVRSLAQTSGDDLIVWTGTSEALKLTDSFRESVEIVISNSADASNLPVSTYLWKVVQNPKKRSSLVIIQLNVPDITSAKAKEYVKCKNICRYINWMSGKQWSKVSSGYTFCCRLADFEDKFGYRGHSLFGTGMDNVLQQ